MALADPAAGVEAFPSPLVSPATLSSLYDVNTIGAATGPARQALAVVTAWVAVKQVLQHHAAHLLHRGAHLELGGAQVQPTAALAGRQEAAPYARDFRLDRLGNLFFRVRRYTR